MAIQEQWDILQQGVEAWNTWRAPQLTTFIDLSGANLYEANLSGAHLSGANLYEANLGGANLIGVHLNRADLTGAHFRGANLNRADLRGAHLNRADLTGAHLYKANLSEAHLSGANLYEADLRGANLSGADLSGADLSEAHLGGAHLGGAHLRDTTVGWTVFGDVDIRTVKDLETIQHKGPSYISTSTLSRSQGDIPDIFLRGAGLDNTFIDYVRSLASKPIEYYTCFISYSNKDDAFAKQLYADLQSHGVRCWFAPHSMRPGTVIVRSIDEAIRLHDKLLLILSQHSVESTWVAFEVTAALEKEKKQRKETLFPIRLDNAILTTQQAWAAGIRRQRHIGDFTQWKDHDTYQQVFSRLLHDLQTSATKESH